MAKERIFDLPETKGSFQLKGIVSGTEKSNFYKELKTRTNKDMRIVNFGLEYEKEKSLYVNLQGTEKDEVYYSKKSEVKGQKGESVKVPWASRFTYNREGFKIIGKNIGVKKIADEEGKFVNDKKTLVEFDACKEVSDNLKDKTSVFTRGDIVYSSKTKDDGTKATYVNLSPNQISLCGDIDFTDDKFEAQNDFHQVIVYMGIDKEKSDDGKETGRFIVSAKIVTYKTIEDVEFVMVKPDLAKLFKTKLKPYTAIQVSGKIVSSIQAEAANDDCWGDEDALEKVKSPFKSEFMITGAKPSTIDTALYSEQKINEAIVKINNANKAETAFGNDSSSGDDWGEASSDDDANEPW